MEKILYYLKKYAKDAILLTLILICLGFTIYNFYQKDEIIDQEKFAISNVSPKSLESKEVKEDSKVFVDVKGAVKKPGVYEVSSNAIVNDVIKLAGGFNTNAYQNAVNLSKKVKDEMVVYIYSKNEINNSNNISTTVEICKTSDYTITECIKDKSSIIEVGNSNKVDSGSDKKIVNINTASKDELITLSGVGEAKAEAIIKYRETNGKFLSINDIMKVSGIGEAAFEKIKDFITI